MSTPRATKDPEIDDFAEKLADYVENPSGAIEDPRLARAQDCIDKLDRLWPHEDRTLLVANAGQPTFAPPQGTPRTLPAEFGKFVVHRELGRGGYGIVFLASDTVLRRRVALKVPRPDVLISEDLRSRFVREARAAALLDHPGIVPIFETGEVGPASYIAAAYVEGPTLADWLKTASRAPNPRVAAAMTHRLALAVQHAHERLILHRDLKPANVLLEPRSPTAMSRRGDIGLPYEPKLTDFGLAKVLESAGDDTRSGAVLGTPRYMAPEQAAGRLADIGPATDVYGLGTILYELLVGQPPHVGANDLETLHLVRCAEPVAPAKLRPEVPRDLEAICLRCLEKDPRQRYPAAHAVADDLQRFLSGEPTKARPLTWFGSIWRWAKREPMRAAYYATCVGAVLLLAGTWVWYTVKIETAVQYAADMGRAAAQRERIIRQRLYAAELQLVESDLERGDVASARRRLENAAPVGPGAPDDRELAWRLLHRRTRAEKTALPRRTLDAAEAFVRARDLAWLQGEACLTALGADGRLATARAGAAGSPAAAGEFPAAARLTLSADGARAALVDEHGRPIATFDSDDGMATPVDPIDREARLFAPGGAVEPSAADAIEWAAATGAHEVRLKTKVGSYKLALPFAPTALLVEGAHFWAAGPSGALIQFTSLGEPRLEARREGPPLVRLFASANRRLIGGVRSDGAAWWFDRENRLDFLAPPAGAHPVGAIAATEDGRTVALATPSEVLLYHGPSGRRVMRIAEPGVQSIGVSLDGGRLFLATGAPRKLIELGGDE